MFAGDNVENYISPLPPDCLTILNFIVPILSGDTWPRAEEINILVNLSPNRQCLTINFKYNVPDIAAITRLGLGKLLSREIFFLKTFISERNPFMAMIDHEF